LLVPCFSAYSSVALSHVASAQAPAAKRAPKARKAAAAAAPEGSSGAGLSLQQGFAAAWAEASAEAASAADAAPPDAADAAAEEAAEAARRAEALTATWELSWMVRQKSGSSNGLSALLLRSAMTFFFLRIRILMRPLRLCVLLG
jgi:hypothetical protein